MARLGWRVSIDRFNGVPHCCHRAPRFAGKNDPQSSADLRHERQIIGVKILNDPRVQRGPAKLTTEKYSIEPGRAIELVQELQHSVCDALFGVRFAHLDLLCHARRDRCGIIGEHGRTQGKIERAGQIPD